MTLIATERSEEKSEKTLNASRNLTISFSADKMFAFLSGSVQPSLSKADITASIMETLKEHRVSFGIQNECVESIAEQLYRHRHIGPSIVALGEYPLSENTRGAEFIVPVCSATDFPTEFQSFTGKKIHYYRLCQCVHRPCIVEKNQQVGIFSRKGEQRCGTTVLGKQIDGADTIVPVALPERLGPGLVTKFDSSGILATETGVIVLKDTMAYILPVSMDGAVEIIVSEDRLSVTMNLYAAGVGGKEVEYDDIVLRVQAAGISAPVVHTAVQDALMEVAQTKRNVTGVCIAEGKPPRHGKNAEIELLVDLSFSRRPVIKKDGAADYFSIHTFENVVAGQSLARVSPPTEGEPGVDVYGNTIYATSGKPLPFYQGKNVISADNDSLLWEASKNGHVYKRDNTLLVEEILRIDSDVDFHTGNIDFIGDVVVDGEVKSGFSVRAAGNVTVYGAVEDARIEAGENVIVHCGFIGKGKGVISAEGDVVVCHIRNQKVIAKNNILIGGESVDACLIAGNAIFAEQKKSWIVGGRALAKNNIRAATIGNKFFNPTRITVGLDYFIKKTFAELDNKIEEIETTIAIVKSDIERLSLQERSSGGLSNDKSMLRSRLAILVEKHEEQIRQLQKYKFHCKRELYNHAAQIDVTGTVFPGTVVEITTWRHTVNKEANNSFFYLSDNTIIRSSLSH
jgi:hypothetical protein